MPNSISPTKDPLVQNILKSFLHSSTKDFSVLLKQFQSKYGHWGPDKPHHGWVHVADQVLKGLGEYKDSVQPTYNLLRFLRLLSFSSSVQNQFSKQILLCYLQTIEASSGLIRNAGYQLLDNFKFGLGFHKDKSKSKHIRENWLQLFTTLLTYEIKYTDKFRPQLTKSDLHGRKWRKNSTETKNITLKNIRRGIECIDSGMYLDKILDEFGVLQLFRTPKQIQEYLEYKTKYEQISPHLN